MQLFCNTTEEVSTKFENTIWFPLNCYRKKIKDGFVKTQTNHDPILILPYHSYKCLSLYFTHMLSISCDDTSQVDGRTGGTNLKLSK